MVTAEPSGRAMLLDECARRSWARRSGPVAGNARSTSPSSSSSGNPVTTPMSAASPVPALDSLLDEIERNPDVFFGDLLGHPVGLVAHHDGGPGGMRGRQGIQDVAEHGSPAQTVQGFGPFGPHPAALARGKNDGAEWARRFSHGWQSGGLRDRWLAGQVSNLQPPDSKSGVLPIELPAKVEPLQAIRLADNPATDLQPRAPRSPWCSSLATVWVAGGLHQGQGRVSAQRFSFWRRATSPAIPSQKPSPHPRCMAANARGTARRVAPPLSLGATVAVATVSRPV